MRSASLVALAFIVSAPVAAQPAAPADAGAQRHPQATFRSGVDLIALNVTVTDPGQRYIRDLGHGDFAVYEDGVQQDIAFFAATAVPLDLAILLDTSASMTGQLTLVQQAAIGFIETLGSGDRGTVIAFNDRADVLQPLTGDGAALEAAVRQASAKGATALYNAVYVALREFEKSARRAAEVRRQAIVLLTDGDDTASLVTFDELLDLARRQAVTIYTIAVAPPYAPRVQRASRYFSEAQYAMKTLASETGGRPFWPQRIEDLAGIYAAIAEELSYQYAIGYTAKNPKQDGAFRRIVVRVPSRPDARPRARTGYFAPAAPRAALNSLKH